jgi:hypothetical protein
MEEIWKDIPGYEGRYQVSDQGRVRSVDRVVQSINHYTRQPFDRHLKGQILRPGRFTSSGHVSVILGHKAWCSPVHTLVMLAFVGPCPEGMEVCHNNGIASDNRLANLRYDTRSENVKDVVRQSTPHKNRFTREEVLQIRRELAEGVSGSVLAKKYGVSQTSISHLRLGKTYQYIKGD